MKIHARFKCNEFTVYNALFLFKICFVSLTVRFRAVIKNNFPVDISAQLFFVDDYGERICDAFREPLEIKSAGLLQEQYYEAELSNEFEGEMLDSIRQSKLMVEFSFRTADENQSEMVKFLSAQNISFNFFVIGKTRFELH